MVKAKPKHHIRAVYEVDPQNSPDGGGSGLYFGHVQAWHKANISHSEHCVPNELIAGEIAHFLRLPISPFTISYCSNGQYLFTSLNFNFDRSEDLPPILPDRLCANLPFVASGILLFDILVVNCDRHDENLVVDDLMNPHSAMVFDHDQALLASEGISRLERLANRLGITGGTVTGGNRHCLLDYVADQAHFDTWLNRISGIPSWFIDDVCDKAATYGLSRDETIFLKDFLKNRRTSLSEILKSNAESLPPSEPTAGSLY